MRLLKENEQRALAASLGDLTTPVKRIVDSPLRNPNHVVQAPSLTLAESVVVAPDGWCFGCRHQIPGPGPKRSAGRRRPSRLAAPAACLSREAAKLTFA